MNTIDYIRQELTQAREFLTGTMHGLTPEEAHAAVPGALNPIGATYLHLVQGEDGFVNGLLRGAAPLFAGEWAGRTGASALPPDGNWRDWSRAVRVDLDAASQYAAAVAKSTDAYVASLTPEDLDRVVDLSSFGFGERTVGWILAAGVVGHVVSHWGEICALKGLQDKQGFPR